MKSLLILVVVLWTLVITLAATTQPNYSQLKSPLGFGLLLLNGVPAVNTAVISTIDQVHSNLNYCASINGTVAYTCNSPSKALKIYSVGQLFTFLPDIPCSSACTLNIDAVGIASIKSNSDGVTDVPVSLGAHLLFYDGSVFRLLI
jgi:hypothetical protein